MLNLALKSWMRLRRFLNGSEVSKTALSFFFAVHLISKHTNLPATLVLYWAYTPQKFNLGNPKWVNRNHPACTDKRIQLPGSGSPEIFNKKKHGYTTPIYEKKQIHSSLHSQLGFHSCSHWIGPKKNPTGPTPQRFFMVNTSQNHQKTMVSSDIFRSLNGQVGQVSWKSQTHWTHWFPQRHLSLWAFGKELLNKIS